MWSGRRSSSLSCSETFSFFQQRLAGPHQIHTAHPLPNPLADHKINYLTNRSKCDILGVSSKGEKTPECETPGGADSPTRTHPKRKVENPGSE